MCVLGAGGWDHIVEHDLPCLFDREFGAFDEVREVRLEEREEPVTRRGEVGHRSLDRSKTVKCVVQGLEELEAPGVVGVALLPSAQQPRCGMNIPSSTKHRAHQRIKDSELRVESELGRKCPNLLTKDAETMVATLFDQGLEPHL
jgi:hypothetical protein